MWIYKQRTGELYYNNSFVGQGYSGNGVGKNNNTLQNQHDVGPIPIGSYVIGAAFDSDKHGPLCIPLLPSINNEMFGRSGFLIHGDRIEHPGMASEGCIVQVKGIREIISKSEDKQLVVV